MLRGMNAASITIGRTHIRQDSEGRYCINDLHRAAVLAGINRRSKEPAKFLASRQAVELIKELETTQNPGSLSCGETTGNPGSFPAVRTIEGRDGGTFVVKELVYAYAMWISARFHLQVIRAYDAFVAAQMARLNGLHQRAMRAEMDFLEGMAHASRCGLGLRRWREEKPVLHERLVALRQEMQPMLPMFH